MRNYDYGKLRMWTDLLSTLGIVFTCGFLIWLNWGRVSPQPDRALPSPPHELIDISEAPVHGSADATYVLLEYSDYQCPFCARFEHSTLPELEERFIRPGLVKRVYKHHPLDQIHPFATPAAVAAVCAQADGRFWETHHLLFKNSAQLSEALIADLAAQAGGPSASQSDCDKSRAAERVSKEAAEARRFGLAGTPAFIFGVEERAGLIRALGVIPGSIPVNDFAELVDGWLNQEAAGESPIATVASRSLVFGGAGVLLVAGYWWAARRRSVAAITNSRS